jgi:quercetin dioxygenase-like cupin family protein
MKHFRLENMTRGWFVGDFIPTAFKTDAVEVGFKQYKAGDREKRHHHKIATEITAIISGVVRLNCIEYKQGDVIIIDPRESVSFESITDSATIVVKLPGVKNDKYEE